MKTTNGRRRWAGAAAAALAVVVALTACGDGDGGAATPGPASLRMTVWTGNADHLALLNGIADEYRRNHPNVTEVKFDSLPLESYTTTLTTQLAGGNAPDLAWILESSALDFVASGALVPLDDALKTEPDYNIGDLLPATTRLWQRDGKLFAYPFSTSPFGMFVNLDLLEQAGQRTPAELIAAGQWTWPTVYALGAAVNAKTGKAGVVVRDFDYKSWDYLAAIWDGWGAEAWSEDGKTCGFDKPAMVEAMTALHRAIFVDRAVPAPGTSADFFAGAAAMTITQISRAALLKDDAFAWDLVPLPAGPQGRYNVFGQAGIGVLKQSRNAAAAADFLAFMTNPQNSAKLARFFPPPRRALLTTQTLAAANPLLKPAQLESVVIEGINTGKVKPFHAGFAELGQAVRAALDELWRPQADVPGVLANVCTKIQPLLAK